MIVLLAEDNDADRILYSELLTDMGIDIIEASNGEQVIESLKQQPNLILLDLNLPLKSGLEVLTEIRNRSEYKLIPVIILTSSNSPYDVKEAYNNGVNCYVVKPYDIESIRDLLNAFKSFWIDKVKLPMD
jgi:CheY-like chemotaxis protein